MSEERASTAETADRRRASATVEDRRGRVARTGAGAPLGLVFGLVSALALITPQAASVAAAPRALVDATIGPAASPRAVARSVQAPDEGAADQVRGLLSPAEGETLAEWTERWMDGPVQHIATGREERLFEQLDTTQQRLEFIRLFWRRRDPRIRGPDNEFLEEFERRVAYADERFSDGKPGWDTVFGRVVLAFGPPSRVRRETASFPQDFSDRPPILWSYDERLPELGPNEDLLFVFRAGKWRLLTPSPFGDSGVGAARRDFERSLAVNPVISADYEEAMSAAVQESLVNEVDYEGVLEQVEATVAFADAEIPFGWEAEFAPADGDRIEVRLQLTWRLSSLIFHRVEGTYQTEMQVVARLRSADETVAERSREINVTASPESLQQRRDEVVSETVTLTAPPGRYTLELRLEDQVLGYRTAYREELEVSSPS